MKARKLLAVLFSFLSGWTVFQTGCGGFGYDGLADLGYYSGYYPDYGLYDPTNDIQDVIDYRLDVMDWSNAGWDEYIMQ